MALTLIIPDDVLESLKLPRQRIEAELTQEMAFTLYERGLCSMGVARRYAGLTKWAFLEGLAKRGIQRHYGEDELNEDITYRLDKLMDDASRKAQERGLTPEILESVLNA